MIDDIDTLLTVKEVSERLRVDQSTVRRWVRVGALPAVILPGLGRHAVRVRASELQRILHTHATTVISGQEI